MRSTVAEIAALVGGTLDQIANTCQTSQAAQAVHTPQGTSDGPVTEIYGVAGAAEAGPGDLTFLGNPKYLPALKLSKASAALVPSNFSEPISAIPIRVSNPSVAFATIVARFAPPPVTFQPGIAPSAVVSPSARIAATASIQPCAVIEAGAVVGEGSVIGAACYLGHDSVVGTDCRLHPHVVLRERCVLGDRVIIHSGAVIGSDGFGFEKVDGQQRKIEQIGIVQVDNDVEIGANVTVDRARFGRTWIKDGVKIDNLVQIAHNVVIGSHSVVVAQTGISGSSQLGEGVTLAGQVGIAGHLKIGDGAIVAAQSGVSKNVPEGQVWFGYPATEMRPYKEQLARIGRLEKLYERVKSLEKKLQDLGSEKP